MLTIPNTQLGRRKDIGNAMNYKYNLADFEKVVDKMFDHFNDDELMVLGFWPFGTRADRPFMYSWEVGGRRFHISRPTPPTIVEELCDPNLDDKDRRTKSISSSGEERRLG